MTIFAIALSLFVLYQSYSNFKFALTTELQTVYDNSSVELGSKKEEDIFSVRFENDPKRIPRSQISQSTKEETKNDFEELVSSYESKPISEYSRTQLAELQDIPAYVRKGIKLERPIREIKMTKPLIVDVSDDDIKLRGGDWIHDMVD